MLENRFIPSELYTKAQHNRDEITGGDPELDDTARDVVNNLVEADHQRDMVVDRESIDQSTKTEAEKYNAEQRAARKAAEAVLAQATQDDIDKLLENLEAGPKTPPLIN